MYVFKLSAGKRQENEIERNWVSKSGVKKKTARKKNVSKDSSNVKRLTERAQFV
jgi:hypothetical protein